jgi:hypothetical protein
MTPPKVALSTSSVTVVVESDDRSRRSPGRRSATQRNSSGLRLTAWSVITLVFLSGGLALFDLYLLVAGLQ